jgi:X-Pro dipeptidyl-peptidase (S15 family)
VQADPTRYTNLGTNPSIAGLAGGSGQCRHDRAAELDPDGGWDSACGLFLPESVEGGEAAPVVLETLLYCKDDATASYRPEYERLYSEFGYAVARVDLRGTGSSEGGCMLLADTSADVDERMCQSLV